MRNFEKEWIRAKESPLVKAPEKIKADQSRYKMPASSTIIMIKRKIVQILAKI